MIYYVTIVDFTESTGECKWDYIHPDTPDDLFEHLSDVKDFIPPTTFGIVSVISRDLFGDQLRRMEFKDLQIVIGRMEFNGKEYYVFFLTDIRDNPTAVWNIFREFYESERKDFEKVLSAEVVDMDDINRLRNAFSAFLVKYYRENPIWGGRDRRSLIVEFLLSFAIMGLLAIVTWYINREFGLLKTSSSWITFTFVILVMHFIIPGPIIGYITQYRKHAEIIALLNGVIWTIIVSLLWYDQLQIGIRNSFHIQVNVLVFWIFVIISGLIYGATLILTTVPFASYFEKKSLTSPRKILLPHLAIKQSTGEYTQESLNQQETTSVNVESS